MGFIFGIVNFDTNTVKLKDIDALGKALCLDTFEKSIEIVDSSAVGFCHDRQQIDKGGIYLDSDLIVVADIRIYNNDSLKKNISYDTPQEAFAKAYRKWGTECANHVNGDFAAVVIDLTKKEVFLFRDHIGARPLVYWKSGHQLIFASHEFGLAKSGLILLKISESKLIDTFFRFNKRYTETNFHNVLKVTPGHCIVIHENDPTTSIPYWKPETIRKDKSLTFNQAVIGLREALIKATVSRMESGKVGIHVSGGLDSCGVASIVADNSTDKNSLTGYSWSPEIFDIPADGFNEKELIDVFSKEKNISVKYLKVDKYEMVQNAIQPEFEKQTIELSIMKAAKLDGVKTIFSGWGGDEFVSLSTRGTVNHLFFSLKWKTLFDYIKKKGIKSTIFQFRTDVLPLFVPFGLMPIYRTGFTDWSTFSLFKLQFILKHWKQLFFAKKKNIFGYGNRTAFMSNLLKNYHLPERMESWAINAEHYGIEYKYPLLDKDVLEFWFSIPVEYTYKDFSPRLLYREAMKGILTEDIRIRKNKHEDVFEAFCNKEKDEGKHYFIDIFSSISTNNQLYFLKPEAVKKEIQASFSKDQLKSIRNNSNCIFCIRYTMLEKKYLNNQHFQ